MNGHLRRSVLFAALAAVLIAGFFYAAGHSSIVDARISSQRARRQAPAMPSPVSPATPVPPGRQRATLAGGCFWSMEAIFKQLRGVDSVAPGYSGGTVPNPSYEQVESGTTGHAESLQIVFDPKTISYHDLLTVFFTVRDPTTLDRQGPDEGPQYRSVIFYQDDEQKRVAQQVMREIALQHLWRRPIVTRLTPFSRFYRAEGYHLDYYRLHPDEPYCRYVIAPEIAQFRSKFRNRLKPGS